MRPGIPTDEEGEKLIFEHFGQSKTVEVSRGVRLALVLKSLELYPHVEIIDLAPGIFKFTAMKEDLPKRRIWFKTELIKCYLPEKKRGRYD